VETEDTRVMAATRINTITVRPRVRLVRQVLPIVTRVPVIPDKVIMEVVLIVANNILMLEVVEVVDPVLLPLQVRVLLVRVLLLEVVLQVVIIIQVVLLLPQVVPRLLPVPLPLLRPPHRAPVPVLLLIHRMVLVMEDLVIQDPVTPENQVMVMADIPNVLIVVPPVVIVQVVVVQVVVQVVAQVVVVLLVLVLQAVVALLVLVPQVKTKKTPFYSRLERYGL